MRQKQLRKVVFRLRNFCAEQCFCEHEYFKAELAEF